MKEFFIYLGIAFVGIVFGYFFKGKKVKGSAAVTAMKMSAEQDQKQIDQLKADAKKCTDQASGSDTKRKNVRDKHSKVLPVVVISFMLQVMISSLGPTLDARFIVYDQEDGVNRDYGTITNYVKSLEEEKKIFLATQGYLYQGMMKLSNAMVIMSNRSAVQDKVIDHYQEQDTSPGWWERLDMPLGILVTVVLFMLL